MFRHDDALDGALHYQRGGSKLVARPPGAHRISVPASHHFLELHLGKSEAKYEIMGNQDRTLKAPPGTFIFLPASIDREIKASRSGWSIQLAFVPTLLRAKTINASSSQYPEVPSEADDLEICHTEDDAMVGIGHQIAGIWRSDLPKPSEDQLNAIVVLLIMRTAHHVVHGDPRPPRSSSVSKRVQAVIEHIEADLTGSHTLNELASIAGVSAYHFARMFRQATGRSPHQYVVERRLAHAKRRLSVSDDPIVEIALDCGFGSQSHMTDVFNKVLGTTPGAVRRAYS